MAADAAAADALPPPPTSVEAALAGPGYYISPTLSLADIDCCRHVSEAVWTLSSARPGNGIPELLGDDLTEFWQTDGTSPHIVSIQFRARTAVSEIAFYVDSTVDESYTPRVIAVRAGTLHHDLEELRRIELNAPVGWVRIPLTAPGAALGAAAPAPPRALHTWYLQVVVHAMKANGRDMHMRGLKVLGVPERARVHAGSDAPLGHGLLTPFLDPLLSSGVR
jgi:anaphase-promoting complex subunit 10